MKRFLAFISCLLVCTLLGCNADDTPYVPTGNGLTWDDASHQNTTAPQEDTPEQELVLVYYPDRTMNPYTCTDFTNRALFSLIYQGLFTVDSDYNVTPMLCSRYTVSDDMRTYKFYVDGATFSDGSPVTVEDLYESLQAARVSQVYKGRFRHVLSLKMNDEGGVTFYLNTAQENFPILLDIPIVKAAEIAEDRPLGTGPYYLENSNNGVRLRRRTNWWCDAEMTVTASSIPLREAQSETQIRDAFEFSDVGLVCANPGSDSYADYRCDYELWTNDTGVFLFIGCNVAYSQEEIFETDELRKILTYAIDRKKIAQDVYNGFGRPTTLAMDPEYPYYPSSLATKYEYDPEKFKELLSSVDLPKEPLLFLVNSDDSMRLRAARQIVNMFAECGLQVQISELSTNAFRREISLGRYDMYLGQTRLSSTMDLSPFFRPYGPLSYGSIDNEVLYDLCKDALDNHGNFYDLHKAVAEDGRIVPILFSGHAIYATRGLVSDLEPGRDNIFAYTLGKTLADILRQPDSVG